MFISSLKRSEVGVRGMLAWPTLVPMIIVEPNYMWPGPTTDLDTAAVLGRSPRVETGGRSPSREERVRNDVSTKSRR